MRISLLYLYFFIFILTPITAPNLIAFSFRSSHHLLFDYPSRTNNGLVNAVIEIPAGTTAKWEVDKSSGKLKWEIKNGKYRIVTYLPYIGNYGMVPQTLLPKEEGGDNDPLDIIVLSDSVKRGSVIPVKVIGYFHLIDNDENDYKLIGIQNNSPLSDINSLTDLTKKHPSILTQIELWFLNYKGENSKMQSNGFFNKEKALELLEISEKAFKNKHKNL